MALGLTILVGTMTSTAERAAQAAQFELTEQCFGRDGSH